MILSFQTKWPAQMGELAGKPNFFVEKIWTGLPYNIGSDYYCFMEEYVEKTGQYWDGAWAPGIETNFHPKLHTIRHDPNGRWKPGMKIHPRIHNRTKNSFQFAPTLECVSVQNIKIKWFNDWDDTPLGRQALVFIDGELSDDIKQLALNDGFPSVEAFFQWFNEDTKPETVLIHWSELKY